MIMHGWRDLNVDSGSGFEENSG